MRAVLASVHWILHTLKASAHSPGRGPGRPSVLSGCPGGGLSPAASWQHVRTDWQGPTLLSANARGPQPRSGCPLACSAAPFWHVKVAFHQHRTEPDSCGWSSPEEWKEASAPQHTETFCSRSQMQISCALNSLCTFLWLCAMSKAERSGWK